MQNNSKNAKRQCAKCLYAKRHQAQYKAAKHLTGYTIQLFFDTTTKQNFFVTKSFTDETEMDENIATNTLLSYHSV